MSLIANCMNICAASGVSLAWRMQTVYVQPPTASGAASFAACLRLFRSYPLAVTPPVAGAGYRSMVLMNRDDGMAGFFVLTQINDELFVIHPWDGRDGFAQEIRPRNPVSGVTWQVLSDAMPLPHDGALLGWVTDSQVTAMLAVHCRPPEPWDDPNPLVSVPEIRVMPMAGTWELLHWPPFTAGPLDDGRFWEYVEWGEIVDIGPLIIQNAGRVFWVPSPDRRSARHGCIVVMGNLPTDEYWLPAGVYTDHWVLREGIEPPPAGQLLALPGAVDLAGRLR